MAMGFMKQLKYLVSDLTVNGGILERPLGRTIKKELDDDRIEFLRLFVDLLLNTKYVSKETRIYISEMYITLEGVQLKLRELGMESNINTVKAKVWYDKNKIVTVFGERVLIDVLEYEYIDMASYRKRLDELLVANSSAKALSSLALDLNLKNRGMVGSMTDKEFEEFIKIIAPYSKRQVKYISDNISDSAIGYALYILSNNLNTDVDAERKRILLELLE